MKKSRKRILIAAPVFLLLVLLTLLSIAWWNSVPAPRFYGRASIESFGSSGTDAGQFNEPTGIALLADWVFVADARNARIQVYSPAGDFRRTFGEDFLDRPMNMSFRGRQLYVADYFRDTIEVFDFDGRHLDSITATGGDGQNGGLNSPSGVDVFDDGSLLVADTYNHRVVRLSPEGDVVQSWGTHGKPGRGHDEFRYPSDVAITPDGGFFVADAYGHRIKRFDRDGQLTNAWGGAFGLGLPGPFNGWFNVVSSIDLATDGESILAVDFFNQRIQRFGLDGELLAIYPVAEPEAKRSIMGIASDSPDTVWVTNLSGSRIEHWRLETGAR
ncbi:MAG: hypothetical protein WD397_07710 [Wenzhouxiangellaceae bacterium]